MTDSPVPPLTLSQLRCSSGQLASAADAVFGALVDDDLRVTARAALHDLKLHAKTVEEHLLRHDIPTVPDATQKQLADLHKELGESHAAASQAGAPSASMLSTRIRWMQDLLRSRFAEIEQLKKDLASTANRDDFLKLKGEAEGLRSAVRQMAAVLLATT